MEKIREKLPQTQVIFIGQLPRGTKAQDDRAKDVNQILHKDYAVEKQWIHFLDVSEKYRNSTTELPIKSLYIEDGIHINKEGYKILADSMEPLFKKFLETTN